MKNKSVNTNIEVIDGKKYQVKQTTMEIKDFAVSKFLKENGAVKDGVVALCGTDRVYGFPNGSDGTRNCTNARISKRDKPNSEFKRFLKNETVFVEWRQLIPVEEQGITGNVSLSDESKLTQSKLPNVGVAGLKTQANESGGTNDPTGNTGAVN